MFKKLDRETSIVSQIKNAAEMPPSKECKKNKPYIVLIAGPSGVGKTTLMEQLVSVDDSFAMPTQVTTRVQRAGANDKQSISQEEFLKIQDKGGFLHSGNSYGHYYGTLKSSVQELVARNQIPILDFPLNLVPEIQNINPEYSFAVVYVLPGNIQEWYMRMVETRRNTLTRLKRSMYEYYSFINQRPECIYAFIENRDGKQDKAVLSLQRVINQIVTKN